MNQFLSLFLTKALKHQSLYLFLKKLTFGLKDQSLYLPLKNQSFSLPLKDDCFWP